MTENKALHTYTIHIHIHHIYMHMNCKKKDKEKGKDIGKFSKKSGEKTGSLLFQIQRKKKET